MAIAMTAKTTFNVFFRPASCPWLDRSVTYRNDLVSIIINAKFGALDPEVAGHRGRQLYIEKHEINNSARKGDQKHQKATKNNTRSMMVFLYQVHRKHYIDRYACQYGPVNCHSAPLSPWRAS